MNMQLLDTLFSNIVWILSFELVFKGKGDLATITNPPFLSEAGVPLAAGKDEGRVHSKATVSLSVI